MLESCDSESDYYNICEINGLTPRLLLDKKEILFLIFTEKLNTVYLHSPEPPNTKET